MKVIPIETVPVVERQHIREGVFRIQHIAEGEPESPGNFALMLSSLPETYYSPRHRHNFDQCRYQIEGDFDFDSDGEMKPGDLGYFPEGTYYGPQSSNEPCLTLVLQFGGASGSGYVSMEQYDKAMQELSEKGVFEKGVYTWHKEDGKKVNQDAFEAVWEQVNGRKLVYPGPRYSRPVLMQPDHFDWIPFTDAPGVECRLLGVFSERRTRAALYRLRPGAEMPLQDNSLYFVTGGTGRAGEENYVEHTTMHVMESETQSVVAEAETELLQLGLPYFN